MGNNDDRNTGPSDFRREGKGHNKLGLDYVVYNDGVQSLNFKGADAALVRVVRSSLFPDDRIKKKYGQWNIVDWDGIYEDDKYPNILYGPFKTLTAAVVAYKLLYEKENT